MEAPLVQDDQRIFLPGLPTYERNTQPSPKISQPLFTYPWVRRVYCRTRRQPPKPRRSPPSSPPPSFLNQLATTMNATFNHYVQLISLSRFSCNTLHDFVNWFSWKFRQVSMGNYTIQYKNHQDMLVHCGASAQSWCFVLFRKFRLPIGLHNNCSIRQTCQTWFTKHHNWAYLPIVYC